MLLEGGIKNMGESAPFFRILVWYIVWDRFLLDTAIITITLMYSASSVSQSVSEFYMVFGSSHL